MGGTRTRAHAEARRGAGPGADRGSEVRVEAGAVHVLRLYDVAWAIDLARVEALIAAQTPEAVARIRLTRAEPKAMAFGVPPLENWLGTGELPMAVGPPIKADATARLDDFGADAIARRVRAAGVTGNDCASLGLPVDDAAAAPAAAELGTRLLERVRRLALPAFERPSGGGVGRPPVAGLEEDYLLATVQRFDPSLNAEQI